MNKYEMMYIIAGDTAETAREELIAKIDSFITEDGGEIESNEKIGMKKFAYPINFKNEGFYVLINFTSKPEFILELERRMGIIESIVRQMVIRKDA